MGTTPASSTSLMRSLALRVPSGRKRRSRYKARAGARVSISAAMAVCPREEGRAPSTVMPPTLSRKLPSHIQRSDVMPQLSSMMRAIPEGSQISVMLAGCRLNRVCPTQPVRR